MIPQDTVDRIIDSAQIVDVISDFVSLKRRGANYVACCPFHNEKTPSFYVSPAKGIYKCFGCGKTGTAVGFIMEHESMTYVEALRYLARKYGIEIVEKEESPEEIAARQRNESLMLVMDYTEKFFQESLRTDEGRAIGYAYFRSRGLEDATIEKYGLGWSPKKGNALAIKALSDGYKEEYLTATGVCIKRNDGSLVDKFYDRVIFPIHSVSGRVIAFGGRTLYSDYKSMNIGKYVNSPETEIYDKSRSLYGIYFAKSEIARQDRCYLVEGYLDVLSMHQLGITNVVASSGTSLTVQQIRLIKKFTENVTIMYDGDAAGIHAALRGIGLILKEGMNVKVVLIPDGDDPDSYARKHTLDEVRDFIDTHSQDFIAYKTDLLLGQAGDDPLKKTELINDIADTVALMPDQVKRAVYAQSVSAKFNIDEKLIFARISSTREKMIEEALKEEQRQRMRERAAAGGEEVNDEDEVPPEERQDGSPEDRKSGTARRTKYENPILAPSEEELISLILNHGTSPLEFETDSEYYDSGGTVTVADFIRDALEVDGQEFENSLLRRIYDEYFKMYDSDPDLAQQDIVVSLMNGPDRELADEVGQLTERKYQLTVKNFADSMTSVPSFLVRTVPRTIMVYKSLRVKWQEIELTARLKAIRKEGNEEGNMQEQFDLLARLQKVAELRKRITERLGRVQ
ncbi:MAG: DNA primase [Candidatus Cryptobacteroides sp.]